MNDKLRSEVMARAMNRGADLVGFGGIDRFDDPMIRRIFPETRTVIGVALRVLRGSYRGIEEGTTYYQYTTTGIETLEETILPMILLDVCAALEDAGFEAVPQRRNQMLLPDGDSVHEEMLHYEGYRGTREPQMDFKSAAIGCGLGEKGLSGAILTDDYGPFIRYAFILTDAEFEETPIVEPHLCDGCRECLAACPGHAIAGDGTLDGWQCAAYYRGANRSTNPYMEKDAYPGIPNREAVMDGTARLTPDEAKRVMDNTYFYPPVKHGYVSSICGRACDRACYAHLEKAGKLKKKFVLPLRIREPWKLDDGE